jgi:two-component system, cell cycle response regulator
MKTSTRLNVLLASIGMAAIVVSGAALWTYLDNKAVDEIRLAAQTQMRMAEAVRKYTVEQLQSVIVNSDQPGAAFHPQAVPAFAANTLLADLYKSMPGYSYREVALNPTNANNQAQGWTAEIVGSFKGGNAPPDLYSVTGHGGDKQMHFSRPIRVESAKCLACHGEVAAAPASMRAIYGDQTGFGWKMGDVVGAQIVSVPVALQTKMRDHTFWLFILSTTGMLLLVMAVVNGLISRKVLQPMEAANRTLTKLAELDGLTGAANKRHFNLLLETHVEQAALRGENLALVMIDLDHFKRVNDEYGHTVGDSVLRETADRVRRAIRRSDVFGRVGGEEFALLCPATDLAGAVATARQILSELNGSAFQAVGAVTASLGIAQLKLGESAMALVERADTALYEAKRSGRNRVVLASAEGLMATGSLASGSFSQAA